MAIKKGGRNRRGRRLRPRRATGVAPAASPGAEEQTAPSARPETQPVTGSNARSLHFASSADDEAEGLSSEGPVKVVWVIVALVLAFITIITWLISLGYGPEKR